MNALLAKTVDNTQTVPDCHSDSLRLAIDDNVSGYSTTPTAHVRDLVAAGIKPAGCMVYFAIADRMMTSKGEYFRSNEKLAEETGLAARTVCRHIGLLKSAGYLSVFYVNKQRRLRVLATPPVARGVATSDVPPSHQRLPDKENYTKKTTQPKVCVSFSSLLEEKFQAVLEERTDKGIWGGALERLATTHGRGAVVRGLSVYDSYDPKKIDNPVAFLTKAITQNWKPAKAKKKKSEQQPVYWNEAEYVKGCK